MVERFGYRRGRLARPQPGRWLGGRPRRRARRRLSAPALRASRPLPCRFRRLCRLAATTTSSPRSQKTWRSSSRRSGRFRQSMPTSQFTALGLRLEPRQESASDVQGVARRRGHVAGRPAEGRERRFLGRRQRGTLSFRRGPGVGDPGGAPGRPRRAAGDRRDDPSRCRRQGCHCHRRDRDGGKAEFGKTASRRSKCR